MDPDVIEIPPPIHLPPRLKKQKHAIVHDVIDIDDDDNDSEDLMIIGEKVSKSNNGKKIDTFHVGYDVPQDVPQDAELSDYTLFQPGMANIGSSMGSSNMVIKMDGVDHSFGADFFSQAAPSKKKSATSQHIGHDLDFSLGVESSNSQWFLGSSRRRKKPSHAGEPLNFSQFKSAKKEDGYSYYSDLVGYDGSLHPLEAELENTKNFLNLKSSFTDLTANPVHYPVDPLHVPPVGTFDNVWVHKPARDAKNGTTVDGTAVTKSDGVKEEIMRKFQSFKQFDTVEDFADHHYIREKVKLNAKSWAKKIQEEWKILEKDLPDSIFVRVNEARIDLLRAVIIGAEGTPYHDGLFFFDVFFPSTYPKVPPKVHYHSGGLRLNPNLYHCGKVCLSLLGTWSGNENEKWLPGVSTILQVLVSIQGLILNAKPYFNEPGYAAMSGSANGELQSLKYNEDTFILSLRTMMYMMKKPPKHFNDFVEGHFFIRAPDILLACKAYMEGAQVGCLVKGGVQDVDESNGSCSKRFKDSLTGIVNMLVGEFVKIGAKDCEKFLPPGTIKNNLNNPWRALPVAGF